MRNKAPLIFLIIAVALAGAAAWGAQRWMQTKAARLAASKTSMARVVVSAKNLEAGMRLDSSMLRIRRMEKSRIPAGHFSGAGLLAGRVLSKPLAKGEIVLASKLARRGVNGGLSAVVPKGYRAMTVRVNEVIGVGGFVQPGDRVDVLLTFSKGPYRNDPVSRTILQDVTVLTVGQKVQSGDKSKRTVQRKSAVVTLKLTLEQAERLALSSLEGKVMLALRSHGDHQDDPTAGVRLTAMLPAPTTPVVKKTQTAPEVPAAPAAALAAKKAYVVEVIKGTKRTQHDL